MNENKNDYRFSLDANILFLAVIAVLITVGVFAISMSARMSALNARLALFESKNIIERAGVLEEKIGWLEDRELAQEKFRTDEYHKLLKGGK